MWRDKLRDNYDDFEQWEYYSSMYGLASRLGFKSADEAWQVNPLIQGSTNPDDFSVVNPALTLLARIRTALRSGYLAESIAYEFGDEIDTILQGEER